MWLDQLVLVLAVCALGGAALRVAALVTAPARGGAREGGSVAELVLVAVTLGAAFVVVWTLALGLAGRSGSIPWLAAGPAGAYLITRARLTGTVPSPVRELWRRWSRATSGQRVLALTLTGLAVGAIVELARQPGFGIDALEYHLADVFGWLHSGHAGAVQTFKYDVPVGYYPVTNEVLLSWVLGLSRSFAPLAAWSTGVTALLLLALWRLLAVLRVPRGAALAAVAAVGTLPTLIIGINETGPGTDVVSVSWLACTAALSLGARERPALLGPALLAAGLGIGTKTTVAPLAVFALLLGAWRCRAALGAARGRIAGGRGWIAGGAVGAALVGAPWYVRDTLVHGWPLWPFSSGPTGDPMPHTLKLFDVSFLSRPGATLSTVPGFYPKWVAGGIVLIGGALAAPLLARTRAALVAAAVAAAAVLAWGLAPFTGVATDPLLRALALTDVRYLLAPLCACAVALAVIAREGSPSARRVVTAALAAATVVSIVADASIGYPAVPTPRYLLVGATAGALVGLLASWLGPHAGRLPRASPAIAGVLGRVAIAAAAVAALAIIAPGWLGREAANHDPNSPVLAFMLTQPGFVSGSQPIGLAPTVIATLGGPRLGHPLSLIPAREPCAAVRARLRRGWVVLRPREVAPGITTSFDAPWCLRGVRPVYDDGTTLVYAPVRS